MLPQQFEQLQIHRRQAADANQHHPLRQTLHTFAPLQHLQHALQRAGTVFIHGIVDQITPQACLPQRVRRIQRLLAALPGLQPVGAVDQVLIEYVGQTIGQRITPEIAAILQIGRQHRRTQQMVGILQPAQDAQGQHLWRKHRTRLLRAQHAVQHIPEKRCRQRILNVRGNPLLARQAEIQPAPHALGLHHDNFLRKRRRQRLRPHHMGKQLKQVLKTVGLVEMQHGRARQLNRDA